MDKKQIENSADVELTQNTISPMFWESFDKANAVLEKTKIDNKTDNSINDENDTKTENVSDSIVKETEVVSDVDTIEKETEVVSDVDTIKKETDIVSDVDTIEKETDIISDVDTIEKETNIISDTDTMVKETDISKENTSNNTINQTDTIAEKNENSLSLKKENKTKENITEKTAIKEDVTEELEATQRLDILKENAAFLEMLQKTESDIDDLGDKNAYLDTFESESFEEEEEPEDDMYYDEETSMALYRAEKRRLKIILFLSILIGVIVFLVGYIIMGSHQRELKQELQKQIAAEQAAALKNRIVMVRTVATNRELSVHDVNTNEQYIIKTNSDTKFIDRSGRQTSVTKIQRGDLVSVIMDDDGETAKEIYYSANTWMAREVNGLSVNTEQKSVSITFVDGTEPKTYYYTDDKLFLYKDGEIAPESIAPCDVITMQGRGNRVWSIKVIESHGTMTLKNEEDIENGIITIDNRESFLLEGFGSLMVTEGVHKINVTGDNIESFEDTIFVVPREDFVYDLSNTQSKTGVVILRANVYDFKLYINGADADGSRPIVLPYGEYDIIVIKNGYKKWSQTITVEEPSITIDVMMEEDIQESTISFHSVPEGATILWNDKEIGVTPLEHTVRYGVYTLEIISEGYKPYLQTIVVDKPAVDVTANLVAEQNTADQLQ